MGHDDYSPLMSSLTTDARWRALTTRDLTADGTFVYGVASTGIYCRPSCPSRRPRPGGVTYFTLPADAERAGYRACRRCRPQDPASPLVMKVERARQWVDRHPGETPSLKRLARLAGTSPWHLQRSFTRLFGMSPASMRPPAASDGSNTNCDPRRGSRRWSTRPGTAGRAVLRRIGRHARDDARGVP